MFAPKTVWYLPFALLLVTFLLYASIGLWFNEWISSGYYYRQPHALDGILAPETIDALYDDERLHRALISLTDAVAKASTNYGETFNSKGLQDFGKNLGEEVGRMKTTRVSRKKRGFLEDLGNLFSGGTSNGQQGGGDILSSLGSLLGGNSTGGLGGLLSQGLSGIVDGLAMPAFFLGIGLGMGAETGLNLTNEAESKAIATRVASSMGQQPTGFNLVAQNLGSGLSAQLAPALGNTSTSVPIGLAAFALAQGIGKGSASGLNLTQEKFEPKNASDIMGIASNFGLGISAPIAASIDVNKLVNQAGAGGSQIMAQIPQIAAAAGQGLGVGASKGLGLMKANMTGGSLFGKRQSLTDPNQVDIPGAVGNFTLGLSESFLGSSDLTKLLGSGAPGGLNFNLDATGLISLASGAGKGAGEGLAIGLKITTAVNGTITSPVTSSNGVNQTQEQIAEEFVKGLVSGLLQNGGVTALGNAITSGSGGLTKSIDMAKAAEGAARGLVEGSVNAFSQAGGIQKTLSGDFPKELAMNLPSLPPTAFDDSLNGSAVAFTRGLSGEGILLFVQLMNMGKNGSTSSPLKRSIEETGVVPYNHLSRRANNSSTPLAIDSPTLQGILQFGTDTITCQGFGGLAALALGIMNSPKLKLNAKKTQNSLPLDNSTLAALPKDPITITSEGNKFTIKIQETTVTINNLKIVPFAVLTALHVVFTTIAFFYALPAYLALGALYRISVMIGLPFNEAKNKKWRNIILLYIFTPTSLVGIILGIAGMGSAPHFRTVHGVFGLMTLLFFFPTVVTSYMRLGTTAPTPPPSAFVGIRQVPKLFKGPHRIHVISAFFVQQSLAFGMIAWIQGFSELRSVSLCVVDAILTAPAVVGIVNLVAFLQVSAMALLGLRGYLEQRIAKSEKSGVAGAGSIEKGVHIGRTDTIRTFGFDRAPSPELPPAPERKTAELLGREDSKIGWPSNVRKFGDEETLPGRVSPAGSNPFVDPTEAALVSPRVYNAKLGGFEDDRSPAFPPGAPNLAAASRPDGELRPSSEIDPQSRYVSYAAPPMPGQEQIRTPGLQRYESFSRPLNARPSGEESRVGYGEVNQAGPREGGNAYGYGGYGYGR